MKTSKLLPNPVKILALLLGSCLSILAAGRAHAQTADLFASVNHPNPTGPGAIFQYTPAGVQSTFVASVVQPRGVAFDCAGNLFVASTGFDNNGNSVGSILKVTPGGVVSTFTNGFPNNFFLEDITFDSMGNLFVFGDNDNDPNIASTIFKVSPGGGVTIFGTVPGQGYGLAFDSMGNLFAADASDETIFKFTPAGMRSVFAGPSAFLPNQGPIGLAFNSAGNLFVSTSDNTNGQIVEFAPNGAETTFATGLTNNPRGLAFDSAGNLFLAEPGRFRSGDILKFTPGGVETFFATPVGRPQGDGGPEFLAFPAPPCSGRFVIGDNNAIVGQHVTFWGAQWSKQNLLSGGAAPNAFKGFANTLNPNPPACGGSWKTGPGNSSNPPNSIPSTINVIAASSVTQSGSVISGNTQKIVTVKTDPGYSGDPGHAGTGTVISVVCQ